MSGRHSLLQFRSGAISTCIKSSSGPGSAVGPLLQGRQLPATITLTCRPAPGEPDPPFVNRQGVPGGRAAHSCGEPGAPFEFQEAAEVGVTDLASFFGQGRGECVMLWFVFPQGVGAHEIHVALAAGTFGPGDVSANQASSSGALGMRPMTTPELYAALA
jgi:hypothetical protein